MYETISESSDKDKEKKVQQSTVKASDHVTKIYACATMWHETTDEMVQVCSFIETSSKIWCYSKPTDWECSIPNLSLVRPDVGLVERRLPGVQSRLASAVLREKFCCMLKRRSSLHNGPERFKSEVRTDFSALDEKSKR